jgi:hypothetical protein
LLAQTQTALNTLGNENDDEEKFYRTKEILRFKAILRKEG